MAKGTRHWESAAMLGDASSRAKLGAMEMEDGKYDRAVRHLLISAKMGHHGSIDAIIDLFLRGLATKAQFAEGLGGYQDAVEEMKSPDREGAAAREPQGAPSGLVGRMRTRYPGLASDPALGRYLEE